MCSRAVPERSSKSSCFQVVQDTPGWYVVPTPRSVSTRPLALHVRRPVAFRLALLLLTRLSFLPPFASCTRSSAATTSRCWSTPSSCWASWEERWTPARGIPKRMRSSSPAATKRRSRSRRWSTEASFDSFLHVPLCCLFSLSGPPQPPPTLCHMDSSWNDAVNAILSQKQSAIKKLPFFQLHSLLILSFGVFIS